MATKKTTPAKAAPTAQAAQPPAETAAPTQPPEQAAQANPETATQTQALEKPEQATQASAETAAQTQPPLKPAQPAKPAQPKKGTAGWVDATLKTRHCDGGVCKEAGEIMRMTRGTYERLKKYGRVE